MRHTHLISGVSAIGLALVAACSGSSSSPGDTTPTGSSSGTSGASSGTSGASSGTSGTSGNPDAGGDGGNTTTPLKAGEVSLIGLTSDDQIVYTVAGTGTTRNIEAIPVAGGAPATIGTVATDNDLSIAGPAVAFWTAVDAATGVGKLSLWTKAGGAKANIATDSVPGIFSASTDGTKISFSFNSPADTADIAVTTLAAPATTAGATTGILANVNVVSPACQPDLGFVGKVFYAAGCVGAGKTLTNASLFELADVATPTPTTLVDGGVAAKAIKPQWAPSKAGDKLFIIGITNVQAQIITVATKVIANIENNVGAGFLSDDGSKIFYRTSTNAYRSAATTNNATPANPPAGAINLVAAGGFVSTLGVAPDKGHVFFRKLAPVGAQGEVPRVDVNFIDTTTAAQTGTPLVATATGFFAGTTSTSSHAIFLTELNAAGVGKLKARPLAAGGVDRDIAPVALLPRMLKTGTKGLFSSNPTAVGQGAVFDLNVFDAAAGTPTSVVTAIDLSYEIASDGKTIVYTKPTATGGLYTVALP